MPLTPEANLGRISKRFRFNEHILNLLNQFVGLNIAHTVHTRNTVTR